MEKLSCSTANHQVVPFSDTEIPGTPSKKLSPYKVRNLSSTSLNFIMTPTQLRTSGTSLVTLGDYHQETVTSKPITFQSPRIASPVDSSNIMLPPMTPKTHKDEMFLSPSPTLFSPKMNRRRHQSLPQPISMRMLHEDDDDHDSEHLPCRPISKSLKTRLNCALMNLQNGWFEKSLPELEETTDCRGKHCRDDLDSSTSSSPIFFDSLKGNNEKRLRCEFDGFNSLNVSPKNNKRSPKQTITQKKRC